MTEKETPLLRQYNQIKKKHPDTVLLFRLGDFYETFNEDAEIASKVCGLTLTKRNNGAAASMPLAGFPHHQLDASYPNLFGQATVWRSANSSKTQNKPAGLSGVVLSKLLPPELHFTTSFWKQSGIIM